MPRRLTCLLLLAGCAPSDLTTGPCGQGGELCESDGVTIEVVNHFLALEPGRDPVVARGGLVELFVDDGGASALDLDVAITGGELVRLDGGRTVTVRALEDEVLVEVDLGGWGDYIFIESREVDDVRLMPVEDQFRYGAPLPGGFALARDAFISVVVELVGGETRLYDGSLFTTGLAAGTRFGDVLVVNGTIDPIELTVAGGSFSADFDIPFAGDVASIEVVEGPLLDDPRERIVLGNDVQTRVCFTAMAGGLPVAGLEWRIRGPEIDSSEACALIDRVVSGPLTVEVAGLSRTFDLEVAGL